MSGIHDNSIAGGAYRASNALACRPLDSTADYRVEHVALKGVSNEKTMDGPVGGSTRVDLWYGSCGHDSRCDWLLPTLSVLSLNVRSTRGHRIRPRVPLAGSL